MVSTCEQRTHYKSTEAFDIHWLIVCFPQTIKYYVLSWRTIVLIVWWKYWAIWEVLWWRMLVDWTQAQHRSKIKNLISTSVHLTLVTDAISLISLITYAIGDCCRNCEEHTKPSKHQLIWSIDWCNNTTPGNGCNLLLIWPHYSIANTSKSVYLWYCLEKMKVLKI